MIIELIEPYLEVLNLILAVIIVIVGINVSTKLEGKLKKAWNYFLTAMILFSLHEVFGSLAEFGIFKIDGFYTLTEFVYILAFLISIFVFKNLFQGGFEKKVKNEKRK